MWLTLFWLAVSVCVGRARGNEYTEQGPKVAIVTGGGGGIGRGISEKLAADGYSLVITYHSKSDRAVETKHQLEKKYGVRVSPVKADLSTDEQVRSAIDDIEATLKAEHDGVITALVHNAGAVPKAGASLLGPLDPMLKEWDRFQSLYPKFFALAVERFSPIMPDRRGRIVAITSGGADMVTNPIPGYDINGHAKVGMVYLAKRYAWDLAPRRISVNVVCPGFVKTDGLGTYAEVWGEERLNQLCMEKTPMRSFIEPEDIGDTVAFLCSPKGGFITGDVLHCDGGCHLRRG